MEDKREVAETRDTDVSQTTTDRQIVTGSSVLDMLKRAQERDDKK